jgi:hypothetical protein
MREIDVVQLFDVKYFEVMSLGEMKLPYFWRSNETSLLIHQFPSVKSVITPLLHAASNLFPNAF